MKTSTRNGIGTKLLFHRPAGPGQFEATVWFTFLWFPIFPMSTWLVRPQGMKDEGNASVSSTTYYVEFVEKRKTTLLRIAIEYLCVAGTTIAMWGPLVLFFAKISDYPEYEKTWVNNLWLAPLAWAGALWLLIGYRRNRLYKNTTSVPDGAAAAGQ
jgi:hypothetical protein